MDYGQIIKRAWTVTWRYKALWVLGLFVGTSGCQGNYSTGGSSGERSGQTPDLGSAADVDRVLDRLADFAPVLIALGVFLLLFWIAMLVAGISARGGLIRGVSEFEEGRRPPLRELWHTGFSHFWSMVGVDMLLALPVIVLAIVVAAMVVVPLVAGSMAGSSAPGIEDLSPMCGALAIGVPLLFVLSFVLGIMHLIATRYVVLGGQGAVQASSNAWRFLRTRLKDSAILWLINAGLNIAASIVLVIPILILVVPLGMGVGVALFSGSTGILVASIVALVLVIMVISSAFNAVWGTYTSALWTIFFRDVQNMPSVTAAPRFVAPAAPYGYPQSSVDGFTAPAQWAPAPPAPPAPPASDV